MEVRFLSSGQRDAEHPDAEPIDLAFDAPSADVLASDTALWRLYASSFPSSEREPPGVILATVQAGAGFVVRARSAGVTVGLSSAHVLREPSVLFLVYLAVAPRWRSRQIGAALLEHTWTTACTRYSESGVASSGLVCEVEIPDEASNTREREVRRRRLAFFEGVGARVLPQRYLQPPVDAVASVPMHLMYRPAPGAAFPTAAATSALIKAIYVEKYGALNGIPSNTLERLLHQIQA